MVADAGLFWLPASGWQASPKVSRSFPLSKVTEINTLKPLNYLNEAQVQALFPWYVLWRARTCDLFKIAAPRGGGWIVGTALYCDFGEIPQCDFRQRAPFCMAHDVPLARLPWNSKWLNYTPESPKHYMLCNNDRRPFFLSVHSVPLPSTLHSLFHPVLPGTRRVMRTGADGEPVAQRK